MLPTKPLWNSSALVGKTYTAAGQAGDCLHTMAVLQIDLLKELDEGEKVKADHIQELRLSVPPRRPPELLGSNIPTVPSSLLLSSWGYWVGAAPAMCKLLIQGGPETERRYSYIPAERAALQAEGF